MTELDTQKWCHDLRYCSQNDGQICGQLMLMPIFCSAGAKRGLSACPDQSLNDVCSASANGETMYSSAVRSPVAITRSASYDLQPGFFRCGRRQIKPRQIMILKLAQLKMRTNANNRLQIVNYGR
jgi:hypothetical protein